MFALDIRGHLNSLRLAESKALWPLFEAVVNSIQSIEDSPNRDNGKITIFAQREDQDPNLTIQKDVLERFESFVIEDNGNGMNTANYRSFNTAYSTLKIQKGCKGIGRFLWLKAFETVEIESVFQEDGQYYRRKFSFNPDGVSPENNLVEIDEDNIKTIVRLNNFATQYRHAAPVELPVIAKRIIEHCLPFFISGHCPQIIIRDGVTDTIDLNQYFESNIRDSLHQDRFQLQGSDYVIYHLRLPEGTSQHELHLCANILQSLAPHQ